MGESFHSPGQAPFFAGGGGAELTEGSAEKLGEQNEYSTLTECQPIIYHLFEKQHFSSWICEVM